MECGCRLSILFWGPVIPVSFEPSLFCFVEFVIMQQPPPTKAYTSSAAGQVIHQPVKELPLLPSTRTINGTMLEALINQDMLMVRSHLVH